MVFSRGPLLEVKLTRVSTAIAMNTPHARTSFHGHGERMETACRSCAWLGQATAVARSLLLLLHDHDA